MSAPFFAHAQGSVVQPAQMQVTGTVGVFNGSVVQQGSALKVTFTIANGNGAQADIKYAVVLQAVDPSGSLEKADVYVVPDTLSLSANQSVEKTVTYAPPAFFSGSYQVWVEAANSSGLVYSNVPVGTVSLAGAKQSGYAEFPAGTCVLLVNADVAQGTFNTEQGVDILPSESLTALCPIQTHFASSVALTPSFTTYARSQFGAVVSTQKGTAIAVDPKGGNAFFIKLPIPAKPQAYDVNISLLDASGALVSNAVTAHYVLRGPSGTIQSAVLDKDAYASGDTAHVTVNWTGSADNFPGARYAAATSTQHLTLQLALTAGQDGQACGADVVQQVAQTGTNALVQVPVAASCTNPALHVTLKDADGAVLDEKTYSVATQGAPQSFPLFVWIGAAVAILGIVLLAVFAFTRKRAGNAESV